MVGQIAGAMGGSGGMGGMMSGGKGGGGESKKLSWDTEPILTTREERNKTLSKEAHIPEKSANPFT